MNRVVAFIYALGVSAMGAGFGSLSTKAMLSTKGGMNMLSPFGIVRTAKDTVVVTGSKSTLFLSGDTIVTRGVITQHDASGRPAEFLSEMVFMGDTMSSRTEYVYSADGETVITTTYLKQTSDGDWVPETKMEMELFDASHLQKGILYQEMRLYTWDRNSRDWVRESHTRAEWTGGTADCPELITERKLDTVTGNWVESGRMYPVCNSDGSLSTFIAESFDDVVTGAWYEWMRYTYVYNDEGRLEKMDMEIRIDPLSEMEHYITTEYTYGTISLAALPSLRHFEEAQAPTSNARMYDLRGRRLEACGNIEISGAQSRLVRVGREGVHSWRLMPAFNGK